MSGKGDTPRPLSVSKDKFNDNFDAIFKAPPLSPEMSRERKKEFESHPALSKRVPGLPDKPIER